MIGHLTALAIGLTERGFVPDSIIRTGIKKLCRQRLADLPLQDERTRLQAEQAFIARMDRAPVAPLPHKANEQHYEVPPEFFAEVLGNHRKYSCCFWGDADNLDQAEADSLRLTCERAGIKDGHAVLELGCGWGSLSLWIAEHFPNCRVVSVSNSAPQRSFIHNRMQQRGLDNLQVVTADMNDFSIDRRFDRVVSVEMFEHMRNYRELFARIHAWLEPDGRFFMHIFCHHAAAYEFIDDGPGDWMSRHFFSGGIMPSEQLPARFQDHLQLTDRWWWSGEHYQRTANAWLQNMDQRRAAIMPILTSTYGADQARKWFMRWRIFFMACAELFGYERGQQWGVGHYLFGKQR